MAWLAASDFSWHRSEPLSLVAFASPCLFREIFLEVLDRARIAWRLTYTTTSLFGLLAVARSGLGITARTANPVERGTHVLGGNAELLSLPPVEVSLHGAGKQAVSRILVTLLTESPPPERQATPVEVCHGGAVTKQTRAAP